MIHYLLRSGSATIQTFILIAIGMKVSGTAHTHLSGFRNLTSVVATLLLALASYTAQAQETVSATYTSGHISTAHIGSGDVSTSSTSGCPGILSVTVPAGKRITTIDVAYTMTATDGNYLKSQQRSLLECVTTEQREASVAPGSGDEAGAQSYNRTGITIAQGATGTIEFKLHAWRTYTHTGTIGCHYTYQRVDDNTWNIMAHLEDVPLWYPDADGDGYVSAAFVSSETNPDPEVYYAEESLPNEGIFDCDDNDQNVNPGTTEIEGNGIDDDCNPATRDLEAPVNNPTDCGQVLAFDGVNDKVVLASAMPIGSSSHTIEMWVKIPSGAGRGVLLGNYNKSPHANWEIHTGNLRVYWADGNIDKKGTEDLRDNQWHHVAFVRDIDADTYKAYIDGVEEFNHEDAGNDITFGNAFVMGSDYRPSSPPFFKGHMDEVKVWNRALTVLEVSQSAAGIHPADEATALTAHYDFNNQNGSGTLANVSSNEYDGTLTNMDAATDWVNADGSVAGQDYYTDVDGDTYVGEGVRACSPPDTGYFLEEDLAGEGLSLDDCDDTNLNAHEIMMWYTDVDGDDYVGEGTESCGTPGAGYFLESELEGENLTLGDCDDNNINVNPGATEVQGNGIDDDCDPDTADGPANSLHFDGTNDYITGTGPALANQSFTLEFWAQQTDIKYQMVLFMGSSAANKALIIAFRSGGIAFSFWSDDLDSEDTIDESWHHYAMTYDQSTKTQAIYIDGELDNTRTANADFSGTDAMLIGRQLGNTSRFFEGNLDEFRIWNTARSAGDIAAFMNCELNGDETGLLAYYPFNQGGDGGDNSTVTTLTDATTNGYDGTLTDFALSGTTSNWTGNSLIAAGSSCGPEPRLHPIGNQSVDQNFELTFTASASYLYSSPLTYSIDGTSSGKGMSIGSSTGAFSWTPTPAQVGEHNVTVTVSDGELTDSEEITISVTAPIPFITTWKTDNPGTSADTEITIPTEGSGYNYNIYWEDVNDAETNGTLTGQSGEVTIDFTVAGTYRVEISGDFPRIYFNDEGDKNKILTVEQWGDVEWTSMERAFMGCGNLTVPATDAPNLDQVTNMSLMFYFASSFNGDLSAWDVSNVSNMDFMFFNTTSFTGEGLSEWIVSGVTSMNRMFYNATSFNADLSEWNVSSVTDMGGMFSNASSFNDDLGGWDIANFSNMSEMLDNSGLSTANYDATLTGWATSQVPTGRTLGADGLNYSCAGADAHDLLITATEEGGYGWTITDAGEVPDETAPVADAASLDDITAQCEVTDLTAPTATDNCSGAINGTHDATLPITESTTITWTFTDGSGNESTQTQEVVIANTIAPELAAIGNQSVKEGAELTFTATATDACSVPTYGLDATSSGKGMSLDEFTGAFSWTPTSVQVGTHPVTITASDGELEASETIYISVLSLTSFVTTWQTTAADESITIPTTTDNGEVYSYTVDWGDGTTDATIYTGNATHGYVTQGTYTVSIYGDFPRIYFNNTGDKGKILTVAQWGDIAWTSMERAFRGCNNLTVPATDAPNLDQVTDMSYMFFSATSFNGDLSTWDVSKVTVMRSMFGNATSFTGGGLSGWNVSNVTNMWGMFYYATSFNQPLDNWDVSNVTNMQEIFRNATSFNADLSTWQVGNVTNMFLMFREATSFNGDLSEWNVSSVTDMSYMFFSASSFNSDLSGWNVSNVTNMSGMFYYATSFNQPLDNWDVSNVTNMREMFRNATSFNSNLGNWDIGKVSDMQRVLENSGLSTANYDATLIGWVDDNGGTETIPADITLDADGLTYSCAANARESLVVTHGWTITDAGDVPDETAPAPDVELPVIETQCAVTSLTAPTATDNCSGTITGTHDAELPITESATITWTFTDGSGNASTQTQEVVIDDTTAPVADAETLETISLQCGQVDNLTAPTATDNCSGAITGFHEVTLPITESGTIIWAFTDGSGNQSTQTQEVVIEDTTAPVADAEALETISLQCGQVDNLTAPIATDNCNGVEITVTHDATLPITESTTITWTFTDGSGNISKQTQEIVIDDITAPVADAEALDDITAACEVTSLTAPTATDNCAGEITGTHNATFPITASTTITWAFTDGSGNESTQTQEVVIEDTTAPVADAEALETINLQCGQVDELTAPTATDNCSGAITGTHNAELPITESTTITWTFTDGSGNESTQTQNVVIDDTTAPVTDAESLDDITAACEVTSLTAPTATDNCSGAINGNHDATLPITESTIITWTFTDGSGNESTQTQNVVIDDTTAPVADVESLDDITATCEVTSLTAPTATDNCSGSISGTHNATLPITASTTITWTFTDGSGNASTQTQNVVIDDTTAPVADAEALETISLQCGEADDLTAPTATDNCDGAITGTHDATLPITESATITWTFTDGSGNTSTQTQEVVIDDTTAPVADAESLDDITVQCEVTDLSAPTATDNCSGAITGTHDATLPITESATVTWTFTDGSGNASTQTQEVVIEDTTAPELAAIGNHTVDEGVELTFTATVTDVACSVLTYSLDGTSSDKGMVIDASSGAFTWTPTTGQVGDHSVTITVSDGEVEDSKTISITVNAQTVLGMDDRDENSINIFPNPVAHELRIDSDYTEAALYNINGELMKEWKGNKRLDVSGISAGLYILKVTTDKGSFSQKLVKE